MVGLDGQQWADEPLIFSKYTENGLCNPESTAVCLILWLYSIEPPFYAAVNEASRLNDMDVIETLGPFARVLHMIFEYVEFQREDRLECGNFEIKGNPNQSLGNFCKSFLLFRAVKMTEE